MKVQIHADNLAGDSRNGTFVFMYLAPKVQLLLSLDFYMSLKIRKVIPLTIQNFFSVVNAYGAMWKDRMLTSEEKKSNMRPGSFETARHSAQAKGDGSCALPRIVRIKTPLVTALMLNIYLTQFNLTHSPENLERSQEWVFNLMYLGSNGK